MPLVIACPTCQQKIRAPETVIGRQIKCPQCKTPFVAQDTATGPANLPPPDAPTQIQTAATTPANDFSNLGQTGATWPGQTGVEPMPEAESEPRSKSGGGTFMDYILFRRMVTPWIVIFLFYFVTALLILSGVIGFVMGILAVRSSILQAVLLIIGSIFGTLLFMVLWRIYCEVLMTFFRILDNVRDINEQMRERKGGI